MNAQVIGAVCVLTLLFARVTSGQTTPAPRGLVSGMGGIGILTASGEAWSVFNLTLEDVQKDSDAALSNDAAE